MALANTNISTTLVGNTLSNTSRNIGALCTAPTINVWSRYRPGYFNEVTNTLAYNAPDGVSVDPRGIDPQTGSDIKGFKLGDFRGYNHTAIIVGFNKPVDLVYSSSQAGTSVSRGVTFNFGEFDWKDEDPAYRAGNAIPIDTYLYVLDGTDTLKGSVIYPAVILNGYETVQYAFTVPNQGSNTNFTVRAAMGDVANWRTKVGTTKGALGDVTFNVRTRVAPQLNNPVYSDVGIEAGYIRCDTAPGVVVTRTIDATTINIQLGAVEAIQATKTDNSTELFNKIAAKWELSGFQGTTTKYLISSSRIFQNNNGNNIVTLPVGGSPSTFSDDDNMTLTLSNILFI